MLLYSQISYSYSSSAFKQFSLLCLAQLLWKKLLDAMADHYCIDHRMGKLLHRCFSSNSQSCQILLNSLSHAKLNYRCCAYLSVNVRLQQLTPVLKGYGYELLGPTWPDSLLTVSWKSISGIIHTWHEHIQLRLDWWKAVHVCKRLWTVIPIAKVDWLLRASVAQRQCCTVNFPFTLTTHLQVIALGLIYT